jgi:hypothetical protein
MTRLIEGFMNTYGKYMAAAMFAMKPCSKGEVEYLVKLYQNDSQK